MPTNAPPVQSRAGWKVTNYQAFYYRLRFNLGSYTNITSSSTLGHTLGSSGFSLTVPANATPTHACPAQRFTVARRCGAIRAPGAKSSQLSSRKVAMVSAHPPLATEMPTAPHVLEVGIGKLVCKILGYRSARSGGPSEPLFLTRSEQGPPAKFWLLSGAMELR